MPAADLPELLLPDAVAWRAWLAEHGAEEPGVWLVLHKKGGDVTGLDYQAALDEALCFGWIDGQVSRRDEGSYRQRFTPRRARSVWSARNVQRVTELEAEGRLAPAGAQAAAEAQADGRWDVAYAGQATAEVPADLLKAIEADADALAMFGRLTRANRYALIYRVNEAKRSDTRARRIEQFVGMLAAGETIHPQADAAAARRPASGKGRGAGSRRS